MEEQHMFAFGGAEISNERLATENGGHTPYARKMASILLWIVRIFATCIVIQMFIAGLATFTDSTQWTNHMIFAKSFSLLPLVMIATAFAGRLPVSIRLRCIQLLGMIVVMFVTAVLSAKIGILSALHPVVALLLFWSSLALAKRVSILLNNSR